MALNQKDPMMLWGFFLYKLTPQLIKFNIPKMIEFHSLHWEVQVFYITYSKSYYKRVLFFIFRWV